MPRDSRLVSLVVVLMVWIVACAPQPAAPVAPKEAAPAVPKAAPQAAAPAAPKEAAAPARGPVFPEKPVTLIVAQVPGGGIDQYARMVSEATKPYFPQPLVVVNRGGGGQVPGTFEVIQAKPDGYTIGIQGGGMLFQPLVADTPWKGPDDFRPISKLASIPLVFVITSDAPWKTMKELLDDAKANPGKIRVATAGITSSFGIALESLKDKASVDLVALPLGGTAAMIPQLLGGHVQAGILAAQEPLPHVKAGKFKVVATFEEKRLPVYQDAPTFRELGYEVVSGLNYYFMYAPKATPDNVAQKFHDAFKQAAETPAFKKFVEDGGAIPDYKGPADLKQELARKYATISELVRQMKLRPQG